MTSSVTSPWANHNCPPLGERNVDRGSEFATYRFLADTAVPAPEVYAVVDDSEAASPARAGYILMEKLAGKPCSWWSKNEAEKEYFTRQLADCYISLAEHPFDKLGRLQISPETGLPTVGPAFFDYGQDGTLIPFGPFSSSNAYYKALISYRMGLIYTGEIAASAPSHQYLVYKTLLDNLPPEDSGPFFLRHVDSRDANF
ncbi:hypothetical protein EDC01DRAFT_750101 [Geopyxis carbonaria]|nr:hypothetical protein EDC01DRAFT_750101 [Geopyxis carbonaria]